MSLPVVSNALTKAGTLAAVVVVLAVVEAGLSLAYTGDIGAPIVALLENIFKKQKRIRLGPIKWIDCVKSNPSLSTGIPCQAGVSILRY